jgi:hypothetical protein
MTRAQDDSTDRPSSFQVAAFLEKISQKIQQLQFIDDQLYIKAKIINFNFESVENPERLGQVQTECEQLTAENQSLRESFQDINLKYQTELKFKNDLIQEVLQK